MALIAALVPAGFGLAQFASSAPPSSFCERKPSHPRCVRTTTTTLPPSTVTVEPPAPTTGSVANVWVAP